MNKFKRSRITYCYLVSSKCLIASWLLTSEAKSSLANVYQLELGDLEIFSHVCQSGVLLNLLTSVEWEQIHLRRASHPLKAFLIVQ